MPLRHRFPFLLLAAASSVAAAATPTPIRLDELPPPPAELQGLIEAGDVRMEIAADDNDNDGDDDGEQRPVRRSGSSSSFAAETRFEIAIDYRTENNWRIDPGREELHITLKLKHYRWKPSHTIWFRQQPATETFWTNPLVLHEFDHVRLSMDPRWRAGFDALLREPMVIRHPIADNQRVNQRLVDRLANAHLQKMIAETIELIQIRYQELDRETNHGRKPLSEASPLHPLLRGRPPERPKP